MTSEPKRCQARRTCGAQCRGEAVDGLLVCAFHRDPWNWTPRTRDVLGEHQHAVKAADAERRLRRQEERLRDQRRRLKFLDGAEVDRLVASLASQLGADRERVEFALVGSLASIQYDRDAAALLLRVRPPAGVLRFRRGA